MKKIIAFLLTFILVFGIVAVASESKNPATQTDLPGKITVTKYLQGEIWQVRCDVMSDSDPIAGGGHWKADITNHENLTSKEGHRSNHCGSWENWVLFVNKEGIATGLYQLKSGSTGGTLPSIMYKAPDDLKNVPENELYYNPVGEGDAMTARLNHEVFVASNIIPFSAIELKEGNRLFWISQNGKQVWHHTGVLRKTYPRFVITVNGVPYSLGVGETITIYDIEEGLLELEEIATANYKLQAVNDDGEGNYTIINEIDDPGRPTATPPPDPTETPTPTPSPTPSPSPTPTINISGYKIWDDNQNEYGDRPDTIRINLYANGTLIDSIDVSETDNHLKWSYSFGDLPAVDNMGEKIIYTIIEEEVQGYEANYRGFNVFNAYITPTASPTVTPTPTPTFLPTPSPTPSPTLSPTPTATLSPTPTVTPTPTPTPSPSPSPTPTPTPTATPTHTPSPSPTPTATPSPTPTAIPTATPSPTPNPSPTSTPTVTPTPTPSPSPTPTITPSPSPTSTSTPSPTPTVTPTVTPSPTPTNIPIFTPTPTPTPSPSPTMSPSPTPSPTPTLIPTPEPIPNIIIGAKKIWNDKDNSAERPIELHITLYANGSIIETYILNENNHWSYLVEVPELDKDYNTINYSWKEQEVLGYEQEKVYVENDITIFVNKVWARKGTPKGKEPKHPGKTVSTLEDYDTPLGIDAVINHAGDCFD